MDSTNGYSEFARGSARGYAFGAERDAIVAALLDRAGCEPVAAFGRGALYQFPLGEGHAFLREYRRGGVFRHFLKEGTAVNRPLMEWRVVTYLYNAGFAVPPPLGVVWNTRMLLHTGAIATRRVDPRSLLEALQLSPAPDEAQLMRVGSMIRGMHDLGVYHADLHAGNILVGSANTAPHIVDFDKARLMPLRTMHRAQNLLRLKRSFVKHGLRLTDYERILRGYGAIAWPGWLDTIYNARGRMSDYLRGQSGSYVG